MDLVINKTKNLTFLIALVLIIFWTISLPAWGQVYAFKGKVTDEQGNPIVGAKITIVGIDIKRSYSHKTDKKGEFYYAGITRGKYKIGVEAEGYQPDLVSGVIPGVGEATNVDFKLKKGSGKLAINMSEEEVKKAQQQAEEAKKQAAAAAAVKSDFDAGLAASQAGKYDEAIESFKKAIEKDQSQPYVWANLGDAYAKKKQYPEAIAAFNKAIELKSDDATLVQNLGNVYAASGDTAKAQEMYTKAAGMAPAGSGTTGAAVSYYNLGVTDVNAGKSQEAIEAFKKSIAADPSYAEAHYQLGITYIGIGKNDDGVKALQEYLKLVQTGQNAETAKALIQELGKKK
ncbi:MAG TPA: tetratricopeptide repeat protein [Acidobacteriota bacterium]|jgi:tetratricopeptide (TPR) repeat protein|nr:tetratricopeptide repeat protein [Acidobacteriota bacterium]